MNPRVAVVMACGLVLFATAGVFVSRSVKRSQDLLEEQAERRRGVVVDVCRNSAATVNQLLDAERRLRTAVRLFGECESRERAFHRDLDGCTCTCPTDERGESVTRRCVDVVRRGPVDGGLPSLERSR